MTRLAHDHFCHSGAARRAEPGIQTHTPSPLLDSGFALISAFTRVFNALWRPGMTKGAQA